MSDDLTAAQEYEPPTLEYVLSGEGSSAAFAIWVQEQINGTVNGASLDSSMPTMKTGCGQAACIDVRFAFKAYQFQRIGERERGVKQTAGSTPAQRRRQQVTSARAIFDRFILRPLLQPTPPMSAQRHRLLFPPMHVHMDAEQHQQIRAAIEAAETELVEVERSDANALVASPAVLLLPTTLFDPLLELVLQYLSAELFPLFLSTLSCDHLAVESLLLGSDLDRARLLRSAHACFKEEYFLFYIAFEQIRAEIELGPDDAQQGGEAAWMDGVLKAIEQLDRVFMRPNSEYAIYIEPEVRTQVSTALKAARKHMRLDEALLHALMAIKDYALEVLSFDVLPQYHADARTGHVRRRRASLMQMDEQQMAEVMTREHEPPTPVPLLRAQPSPALGAEGGKDEPRRSSLSVAAVDVPLHARRSSITRHPPPPAAAASASVASTSAPSISVVPAEHDVGPAPSSNPQLRSLSELRSRRASVTGGARSSLLVQTQPSVVKPPPPTHSESDEEDDAETKSEPSSPAHALVAAAKNSQSEAKAFASFAASAQSVPAAFFNGKRRSVVGPSLPSSGATKSAGAAAASASSSTAAASSSNASVAPVSATAAAMLDRSVHFPAQPFSFTGLISTPALKVPSSPSSVDAHSAITVTRLKSGGHDPPPLTSIPARSILKTKVRSETILEVLRRVFTERMRESASCLPELQRGYRMAKMNAAGIPAERWVKVSEDGSELIWCKVDSQGRELKASLFTRPTRCPLADVILLRFGAWGQGASGSSARLSKYNAQPKSKPWLTCSVTFPERQVDLVGKNEAEVLRLVMGLQSLAPLGAAYMSRAALRWRRVALKTQYYSLWQGITPELFVEDLLAAARVDVPQGRPAPATPIVHLLDEQIAKMPDEKVSKK